MQRMGSLCRSFWKSDLILSHTVDGKNPANQLRLVVYPIIYKILYIPGGCLGFLPSTVPCNWTRNMMKPMFLLLVLLAKVGESVSSLTAFLTAPIPGEYCAPSLVEQSGDFDVEPLGQCLYTLEWRYGRLGVMDMDMNGHDQSFLMCQRFFSSRKQWFDPTTNSMNGFFSDSRLMNDWKEPKQKQSWQKSRFCYAASVLAKKKSQIAMRTFAS